MAGPLAQPISAELRPMGRARQGAVGPSGAATDYDDDYYDRHCHDLNMFLYGFHRSLMESLRKPSKNLRSIIRKLSFSQVLVFS